MRLEIHLGERGVSMPWTGLEDVVKHPFGPLDVKPIVAALRGLGGPCVHLDPITLLLPSGNSLAPPPVGPFRRVVIEEKRGKDWDRFKKGKI